MIWQMFGVDASYTAKSIYTYGPEKYNSWIEVHVPFLTSSRLCVGIYIAEFSEVA